MINGQKYIMGMSIDAAQALVAAAARQTGTHALHLIYQIVISAHNWTNRYASSNQCNVVMTEWGYAKITIPLRDIMPPRMTSTKLNDALSELVQMTLVIDNDDRFCLTPILLDVALDIGPHPINVTVTLSRAVWAIMCDFDPDYAAFICSPGEGK